MLQLAEQEGWLDEQQELPSEQQLQEVYHEQQSAEEGHQHPLNAYLMRIGPFRSSLPPIPVATQNWKACPGIAGKVARIQW